MEYTKQWATRCVHEAQYHARSCFVTLTYSDQNLPAYGQLHKEHLQKFLRSLRKRGFKLRYFACGEYGDQYDRPHYHALLFGVWPADAYEWRSKGKYKYFRSPTFELAWPHGFVEFSDVSRKNCEYVAGYIRKKRTKSSTDYWDRYERTAHDGALYYLEPEFSLMSKKPGIGERWIADHWKETYTHDSIILDGREWPVPEYYDKWLKKNRPGVWESVLECRKAYILSEDTTTDEKLRQLKNKEKNIMSRNRHLKRDYQ